MATIYLLNLKSKTMRKYFENLKSHPGVEVVATIMIIMFFVLLTRKDNLSFLTCLWLTPTITSPLWLIVLITNYTNNKKEG